MEANSEPDSIDTVIEGWSRINPEIDMTATGVVLRILRTSRIIGLRLDDIVSSYGLNVRGDYEVLAVLRREGPLGARELASRALISSSGVTGRLDRLESVGLVERRPDATDRRAILVALTEKGAQLSESVFEASVRAHSEMVTALSRTEQVRLTEMMRKILIGLRDVGNH